MEEQYPVCPRCACEDTYFDGVVYVCPSCAYEWDGKVEETSTPIIKDANNNVLADGDSVVVIKDLKVKGASQPLKQGTKVKSIRLVYEGDHNIDCKIEGFGAMKLKSEFVKKA